MSEGALVFLCHSSGDKERVRHLYRRLMADRVRCWFDEDDLMPGQDWEFEIGKAIRRSGFVLACLSNSSTTKRGFVQKELRIALDVADEQPEGSTFIIPVRLEDCEIPDRLKRWQSVDLFKPSAYEKLTQALLPKHPERAFPMSGPRHFRTLTWYRTGLERCRAVARLETAYNDGIASAFLIAGPDFHPDLPPLAVVTVGVAVPEDVPPAGALVSFYGIDVDPDRPARFRVAHQLWYQPSADRGLDTSILELASYPRDVVPLALAPALPPKPLRDQRAYIVGHPLGVTQPQFSMDDTFLLDYDQRVLHYRSPTAPGSAGSPVFNEEWQVIGMHHASGHQMPRLNALPGTYAANEGITIDAIRRRLAEQPPEPAA
jgi:hypothetical protein